ncbi:trigger factor [Phenylobacterium montanum]|uniref:Trigger factor n=1 Tax=Phenylobacterium montanum TaxID=2823693 RepID=A0A975G059_9CAUL|nr:trigger factor [Caulobacter sp. S6]QUD88480.1 trigger factor [Caulobacter sp. S6]
MQIVEKSVEGLSRVYGVKVPASELGSKLDARIQEIAPQMRIKGFRPGKVPLAHVRRMHGKALMAEVVQEALSESSQKVLSDNNLRAASQPDLKPESDMDKVMAGEADLAYEMAVEIMPDFSPLDPKTLTLEKPVYAPSDEEVAEALAELAKSNRTYESRKGKTAKAKDGDQLIIDFVGTIDGVAFDGGTAQDVPLVLGSGQFIPGFEEQLVGTKAGAEAVVKVTFPDDYSAETLKGKAAEFAVTVKDVKAPVDAEADDEFAKKLGLETLDALKDALRRQLENNYAAASRFKLKRALLDALDKGHDFPLPPRMVEAEFETIWRQVEQDKSSGQLPEDDAGKSEDELKAEYRKIAERRVRLGLVLAEIGRLNNVQVSDQELLNAIREEAMRYRGQEQQIFDLLRQNQNAQAQLRAPLYEDKVVDLLFGMATVTDKPVTKDELMADDDLPEGYGEG